MRKLFRSRRQRMMAGICGGLGEYLNIDPTIVRILFVLISFLSAAVPGIFLYLIFWLIIPIEP